MSAKMFVKPLKQPFLQMFSAIVLAAFVVLTGCSSGGDDTTGDEVELTGTVERIVQATGDQVLVATGSDATANGSFVVDRATMALTGTVTLTGIVPSSAHLHNGFAGQEGDIAVALDVDDGSLVVPDGTALTSDQISVFEAGGLYLNVHTEEHPAGEIRGQLVSGDIEVIKVALTGDQLPPLADTTGSGTGYVTVNRQSGAVNVQARTEGLANLTASHIHSGYAGENGGPIVDLQLGSTDASIISSAADASLDSTMLDQLMAGGTYINVHTAEVPDGQIRGQIVPADITLISVNLSAAEQVDEVTSTAYGQGFVTVDEAAGTVVVRLVTSLIENATMAHIHSGAVGENGAVLITLERDDTALNRWFYDGAGESADLIAELLSGDTYFNVHTETYPGGEIRGQLIR